MRVGCTGYGGGGEVLSGPCIGPADRPSEMPKQKPQRTLRNISTGSIPFGGPGVYYLVSVWSPRIIEAKCGNAGAVYATARSLPVRVEIVPSSDSEEK